METTTSNKVQKSPVQYPQSDDSNNNYARSRSTNLQNSFNTRHREKNRKNKQYNHYYVKHHYSPYQAAPASLQAESDSQPKYQIEYTSSSQLKRYHLILISFVLMINFRITFCID